MIDLSNLPRMAAFAVIVREGSFTAAARALGVSKASLSEQLAKLESSVGTRLLHRTTRRLSVTEAGASYYQRCAQILDEAEAATAAAGAMSNVPKGTLRLTAPHAMGAAVVIPTIVEFCRLYPSMRVELVLSDGALDLLEHGLDLAIRGGWPESSSLVSRKLGAVPMFLCASPSYVAAAGKPARVAELATHTWALHSTISRKRTWTFRTPEGVDETVTTSGNVLVNSTEGLRALLLAGHGLGVLPGAMAEADLKSGRLVRLLADHALPQGAVYALYPSREHLTPKVERFVELLQVQQRSKSPPTTNVRGRKEGKRPSNGVT